jgi:hypothetical protein
MTIGIVGFWSWLDRRVTLQFWMFPVGANDRLGQFRTGKLFKFPVQFRRTEGM